MQSRYGLALVAIVVLFTLGISMQPQDAYAGIPFESTGYKNPTIAVTSPSSINDFDDRTSAFTSNNQHAEGENGDRQAYGGFGISLPDNAVVQGIEIHIEAKRHECSNSDDPKIKARLSHPSLVGAPTGTGSFSGDINFTPELTSNDVVYGIGSGGSTMWGLSHTAESVENIYVLLEVVCDDNNDEVKIDHLQLEVYYTIEEPLECEEGYVLEEDECVPIVCDEGYELEGDECVPIICPELYTLVGNECIPDDTDEDTIPDFEDQCPADPENFNGFQDEDGCPEVGGNGGDCVNCDPPTLGLNKGGDISPDKRLVEGGFTCNGQTVDVDHFYTAFPLITNQVGEPLVCTFKIYEDTGADKITHFEFAVGKRAGDSMSEQQGKIAWDKNIMTEETEVTYDTNLFRDVSLFASETLVKCRADSEDARCLVMNLRATPKEPLFENIIVKTNVWDSNRNGKDNFYNDGIDFVGNTENALPSFVVLDGKNGAVTIYTLDPTLEDQIHGIDIFGNTWTKVDGFWTKDFVTPDRACETTQNGFDRNCPEFSMQKLGQILLAKQYFDSSKLQKVLPDSYAHKYPERD